MAYAGQFEKATNQLIRIGQLPIYAIDNIVRRSPALQQTKDAQSAAMYINASTLAGTKLNGSEQGMIAQSGAQAILPVVLMSLYRTIVSWCRSVC